MRSCVHAVLAAGLMMSLPACAEPAGQQAATAVSVVKEASVSPRLQCTLAVPAELAAGAPVLLSFTLKNTGTTTLHVLRWQTPLEGILAPMLTIRHQGKDVAYRGMMVKRGAPQSDDYIALEPGQSVSNSLDISASWDLSGRGAYQIDYNRGLMDVIIGPAKPPRGENALYQEQPLVCPSITFTRNA